MLRFPRPILVAAALALAGSVAGCSSYDPTDMFDFLDQKKKLPGERREVFPGGVPGIEQGIPRDLYKGNRPAEDYAAVQRGGTAPPPRQPQSAAAPQAQPDEPPPPPSANARAGAVETQPLEAPPGHAAPPAKRSNDSRVSAKRRVTSIPKEEGEEQAAPKKSAPPARRQAPVAPTAEQQSQAPAQSPAQSNFPPVVPGNTFQR